LLFSAGLSRCTINAPKEAAHVVLTRHAEKSLFVGIAMYRTGTTEGRQHAVFIFYLVRCKSVCQVLNADISDISEC
jgi:hypothetical protein